MKLRKLFKWSLLHFKRRSTTMKTTFQMTKSHKKWKGRSKSQNIRRFWRCCETTRYLNASNVGRDTRVWNNTKITQVSTFKRDFLCERRERQWWNCWILMNGPKKVQVAVCNNSNSFILALAICVVNKRKVNLFVKFQTFNPYN